MFGRCDSGESATSISRRKSDEKENAPVGTDFGWLTFTPRTPAAFADDVKKDTMSKDGMSKDAMKKDTMAKDSMSKGPMKKDSMSKDGMSKDEMKK